MNEHLAAPLYVRSFEHSAIVCGLFDLLTSCRREGMTSPYKLLSVVEDAPVVDARPSRSPVYAAAQFIKTTPVTDSEATLYRIFATGVEKYGDNDCLGAREIGEDGEAGPYQFWSYNETAQRVEKIASAMNAANVRRGAKVGVFGVNCREWMLTMQACNRMSLVCVPIYDTFGENALEFIVNHSETSIIFADGIHLTKLQKTMAKIKANVHNVVYWGKEDEAAIRGIREENVTVHSFEAFSKLGEANIASADPPSPSDICTIMYTSGTTGEMV